MGLLRKARILLGLRTGRRIDLLQLPDGEGCLLRIFPLVVLLEIRKLRLPLLQFLNDQSHLQAPVAQVDVPDHLVPEEPEQPLHALPDDRRPQMPHVKGLGHVGAAVIDDDGLRFFGRADPEPFPAPHPLQVIRQECPGKLHIDKAGIHCSDLLKHLVPRKLPHHVVRDPDGRLLIELRPGHGTVALVFAEVRPVGDGHLPKAPLVPAVRKSSLHNFRNHVDQLFHKFLRRKSLHLCG